MADGQEQNAQQTPPTTEVTATPAVTPVVPAPEVKPVEAPKPVELKSDRFAQVSAKEKQLRQQEQQVKQALSDLQTKQAAFEASAKNLGDLKSDPVGYLERAGVDFADLVKHITSREPPKPGDEFKRFEEKVSKRLMAQEQTMKETLDRQMASLEQAKVEAQQRELNDFTNNCIRHVTQEADKYELINAYGAHEYVPQLILAYAQEHNKVLNFDEAAALVEADLEKQAERVIATKKIKGKFATPAVPVAAKPSAPAGEPRSLSSAAPTTAALEASKGELTDADRRAQAIAILNEHMEKARASGNALAK